MTGCHWASSWEYLVFSLENVMRGFLSCVSIGEMFAADTEIIKWEQDKVTIITKYKDEDEDEDDKLPTYTYVVPLLKPIIESKNV